MKTEDKEVDGLDLELSGRQHKALLGHDLEASAFTDGQLPLFGSEAQRDVERQRNTRLIDAMRQILDSREGLSEKRTTAEVLKISELGLPEREEKALQALQDAVIGRSSTGVFVHAEDRRELLEQALAVLQPNLTSGTTSELADVQVSLGDLTRSVGDLREVLADLEDAQQELLGDDKDRYAEKRKPGKPEDPVDPDQPKPPSTLMAPGPEATREEKPSTLSTGPELKETPKKSTLSEGPEVPEAPEPPSTLGDEKEIAEVQKKKPWWRRPFG